jgi:hypothetical protein
MTKGQIDRLGTRLRTETPFSASDWQQLGDYRDSHTNVLLRVVATLCGIKFPVHTRIAARIKNAHTILEKLRREESMELSNMSDIAGARIVVSGGRLEQDAVVDEVRRRFPTHKPVKDRRVKPVSGYRAVHLVVKQDDVWVELQVRTEYQHRWAQIYERLGDHWGRQIRYGHPPDDPDTLVHVGSGTTRSEVVAYLRGIADQIDGVETQQASRQSAISRGRSSHDESLPFDDINSLLEALADVTPASDRISQILATIPPFSDDIRFLVIGYRRLTGKADSLQEFASGNVSEMIAARAELDSRHQDDPDYETVVLAAPSFDDFVSTHSRYFRDVSELAK